MSSKAARERVQREHRIGHAAYEAGKWVGESRTVLLIGALCAGWLLGGLLLRRMA